MMSCCFENTLHYSSPGHGDWGVVRTGMLLPESCQLFVCPSACGRHGAIGAMKQGMKDRLFYLYVSQRDIIDGYDDLIPEGVDQVLEAIPKRPKVFYIFVSCLDDLIGTDHSALLEKLHKKYPDIQFLTGHMNPISLGSKTPPPVSIQNNLYSVLDWSKDRDSGVNAIGNLVKISDTSELYEFLKAYGHGTLRHISDYNTLSQYQEMGKSCANLVLHPNGRQAAKRMEKKLEIPWLFLPVTYIPDEIEENYKRLEQFLSPKNLVEFEFSHKKAEAEEGMKRAKRVVGNLPIIIDSTAVMMPFGLAKALLEFGFHVIRVECQECPDFDKKHLDWILEYHSEVEIFQSEHHRAALFDRRMEESLAIGIEGAYLAGSKYVVDLFNDEGMFGYDGIVQLMDKLAQAAEKPVDLEKRINSYGLVV